MNIVILEDNLLQQQRMVRVINEIVAERKWEQVHIQTFSNGTRLLNSFPLASPQNIYFLDIQVQNNDRGGLEVAKKIRAADAYAAIVFVTTHSEFLKTTFEYKVSALDFIAKEDEDKFKQEIAVCLSHVKKQELADSKEVFYLESRYADITLPFASIYYFEVEPGSHRVTIRAHKRRLEFYGSLREIEGQDERFYRVHRGIIVNLQNVRGIDKSNNLVLFDEGVSCAISRRKVRSLSKILAKCHE